MALVARSDTQYVYVFSKNQHNFALGGDNIGLNMNPNMIFECSKITRVVLSDHCRSRNFSKLNVISNVC
jgi:hypothetical protein